MSRNKRGKITNASRAGETAKSRGMVYADGKTIKVDAGGKMKVVATDPPSSGSGADVDATYATIDAESGLPNSRQLAEGSGINFIDGGPGGTLTIEATGSGGSVTSVALTATPTGIFNVSGSPVTTSGTLALSLDDQAANKVLAGPTSGSPAEPEFRSLVTADLATDIVTTPKIANDNVTFAKIQNVTTDRILGRDTAGTGDVEELTVTGGLEFNGGPGIQRSALTGDVTASAGSNATTIANDAVTFAKMQNISTDRLLGRDTAGTGDVEEIAVSTDLEFTGSLSIKHSDSGISADTRYTPQTASWNARGHLLTWTEDPYLNFSGLIGSTNGPQSTSVSGGRMMKYIEDIDEVIVCTNGTNGTFYRINRVTDDSDNLATYTSKAIVNFEYSNVNGYIYADYGTDLVMSVDPTASYAIVTSGIAVGMGSAMVLHPASGVIWGVRASTGEVTRLDTNTDTVLTAISMGSVARNTANPLCYSGAGNDKMYWLKNNGDVKVINCGSATVTATITTSLHLASPAQADGGICYNADADLVYASTSESTGLSEIDPVTDTEVGYYLIPVTGASPKLFRLVPCGRYVYCFSNAVSPNQIFIFDTNVHDFIGALHCMSNEASTLPGWGAAAIQAEGLLYSGLSTAFTRVVCWGRR